ncbi:MAG TPA: hypothetical protein VFT55_17030 [Planctomycetota bacterium]|nr:hypothetical protein [Planctomycetota bacterium]
MRYLPFVTWFALVISAGGCDIDVKSVRTGEQIPADLEGVWLGSWQSEQVSLSGTLTLRLQEWQNQPVVSVATDNPCVEPHDYDLALRPGRIELLDDGEVVFAAEFGPGRTLTGTYVCHEDRGHWAAQWTEALPAIVDLSGTWLGTLSAAGFPDQVLSLQLVQSVRNGAIALDALMALPELPGVQVLLIGNAVFRIGGFDLLLATFPTSNPSLMLTGFGSTEPLRVDLGVINVLASQPPLPFTQAVWQVDWQER